MLMSAERLRFRARHTLRRVLSIRDLHDLLSFFHDRLKVYLRDKGARHDLIDAVLASGAPLSPFGRVSRTGRGGRGGAAALAPRAMSQRIGALPTRRERRQAPNDDLLTIVRRVEALGSFLDTDDGKNLLAGTKRAANILAAEEKKGTAHRRRRRSGAVPHDPTEKTLFAAVNQAESEAGEAIQNEDFSAAMRALSALREPVDSFFEARSRE